MRKHLISGFLAIAALSAGPAVAQPDLVPLLTNPMSASVGVRNNGDTASGPSHLTINCTKFGKLDGGCPDIPGMAAYVDPAFPNRAVIAVPALAPGQTFNHNLTFWNSIPWTPGTYVFDAEADAGNEVAESNEANNAPQSSHTEQMGSIVAPPSPLHLKARSAEPPHPKPGAIRTLKLRVAPARTTRRLVVPKSH